MDNFICTTCGTQFEDTAAPPDGCPICLDDRQYVLPAGQSWTTLSRLGRSHMNGLRYDGEVLGISTQPTFAIGQRALLVPARSGFVLWDCISLVDAATIDLVNALGGLTAVAISHPHYYSSMVEWGRAFDVPVLLHAADRQWVMRPDPCLHFWNGERFDIEPGLTLVRLGGHFAGGTVMHWAAGAGGKGALLSGDIMLVLTDRQHVAFMRSYPNFTPLGARSVRGIEARLADLAFDAIYAAFWDRVIPSGGKDALRASVDRHTLWLEDNDGLDL